MSGSGTSQTSRVAELIDQSSQSLLHHTLNTPSTFTTFSTMSEPLSVSQALLNLMPPITDTVWTDAFDRVLKDVLQQCRPGYVEIPTDAVHHKVSKKALDTKPVSSEALTYLYGIELNPASPTFCPSTRGASARTNFFDFHSRLGIYHGCSRPGP